MRLVRLFLSVYIGILVSFVFVFFLGNGSLKEYGSLLQYRKKLAENIVALKSINGELRQEFKQLGTDPEKLRLLARKLSYLRPGERLVRIEGFPDDRSYYEIGRLLRRQEDEPARNLFAKALSLLIPVLFYVISGVITRSTGR